MKLELTEYEQNALAAAADAKVDGKEEIALAIANKFDLLVGEMKNLLIYYLISRIMLIGYFLKYAYTSIADFCILHNTL